MEGRDYCFDLQRKKERKKEEGRIEMWLIIKLLDLSTDLPMKYSDIIYCW
jgi:hypothetical protein